MISKVFVIATGGKLCYSMNFVTEAFVDKEIVSGFLAAFKDYAEEIAAGKIVNFNFRNFNFVYDYDNDLDCMFVLVVDVNDLEEEVRSKLALMKKGFLNRYREALEDWTGNITIFKDFDGFVRRNIFIPPKILMVGNDGVGKTTIMNLFPGETVLNLDEDLNEIIQKTINISGLRGLKQFVIRELDLEEIVDNSKLYKPLLNSVRVLIIVTDSSSSNMARTKQLFSRLKLLASNADFYVIANFQDLIDQSFKPEVIEKTFGVKTYPFSATKFDAQDTIFTIMIEILKRSFLSKYLKKLTGLVRPT
jgi:hypothetical protein